MMIDRKAQVLVSLLSGPTLRTRTGILLLPIKMLGQEANIAARLGIDAVDYRELLLSTISAETKFVNIDPGTEITRLDNLTTDHAGSRCLLLYNIDLGLAKFDHDEREHFWDSFLHALPHRPRALILAMQESAGHLLPNTDLWNQEERIALYTGTNNE